MDSKESYREAIKSIATSIQYMIEQAAKGVTQIYNGRIVSVTSGVYTVQINGNNYTIPQYGNITHSAGDIVKVFVPQGNMNVAFFI